MLMTFVLSANLGTILSAGVLWTISGIWPALLGAPMGGCVLGLFSLLLAGRTNRKLPIAGADASPLEEQVAQLRGVLKNSENVSPARPGKLFVAESQDDAA
jgi:hypothetical protein